MTLKSSLQVANVSSSEDIDYKGKAAKIAERLHLRGLVGDAFRFFDAFPNHDVATGELPVGCGIRDRRSLDKACLRWLRLVLRW